MSTIENALCRVAIIDPLPAFRHGLMAVLREHRFDGEEVGDLIQWVRQPGRRAVLLGVYNAKDLDLVARVYRACPTVTTVALLDTQRASQYRSVLLAGATAAVARAADPRRVVMVLERALQDDCLLPRAVAQSMATRQTVNHGARLSDEQIVWLRALADGAAVSQIAHRMGYSPRQFFRLLRHLFNLMGVKNRHEAIVRAAEWGLLRRQRVGTA